ncbi:MAG: Rpn family recombination-promoting nuclease/putative transposase [Alphaproteobacteria bacterium]|nr:Rpn family recombination-promoting nuclease/putative transposase [Alphaproteobacteria bacterium]
MEKIDPRVDIAFKKIFGVEENKDLLISLINSIVSLEDQVREVTLLNPYNLKSFRKDKLSILDIKAEGKDGKRFNIEIQISDEADYDKRALYYWAKLYTEQLETAEDYASLSKAIGIHILNFTSIPDVPAYHNVFHVTEKTTGLLYFKDLELHTIELKKFAGDRRGKLDDFIGKVKNSLDMWSTFLTRHDLLNKDKLPLGLNDPALKKALGVLEVMNFKGDERQAYEEHLKWLMIEANTLRKYEAKGFAEGKAKGITEGMEKGREEGEKKKAIAVAAIAKNMLAKGMDLETTSSVTGLSIEEISQL